MPRTSYLSYKCYTQHIIIKPINEKKEKALANKYFLNHPTMADANLESHSTNGLKKKNHHAKNLEKYMKDYIELSQ